VPGFPPSQRSLTPMRLHVHRVCLVSAPKFDLWILLRQAQMYITYPRRSSIVYCQLQLCKGVRPGRRIPRQRPRRSTPSFTHTYYGAQKKKMMMNPHEVRNLPCNSLAHASVIVITSLAFLRLSVSSKHYFCKIFYAVAKLDKGFPKS